MHRLLLTSLVLVSCEWVADPLRFERREAPIFKMNDRAAAPANPRALKIMAWNVKYGACRADFWFDFWGDRVQLSTPEVTNCLDGIADLIRQYDPDIVMASEIEAGSKRSAYIDMVQYLQKNTQLTYATYIQTWSSRYVPSQGLGRIDLGNAIFSRYPIVKAEAIRQADRTDQDVLTSTFYIRRAVGRVELDLGNRRIAAYAVHTEAYDRDQTKQKQIRQIYDLLKAETLDWVVGGDFNELPAVCDERADAGTPDGCEGKLRLVGFLDERAKAKGTAFEQPPYTPSVMKPFYDDFEPSISLAQYGVGEAEQRRYFTHSVLGPDSVNDEGVRGDWNRTLDYLFVKKSQYWANTGVIQRPGDLGTTADAIRLSDHAPTVGTWELP
jgi:endonuclease/exonuclease/phosphatase family metal-dependent hydrolase